MKHTLPVRNTDDWPRVCRFLQAQPVPEGGLEVIVQTPKRTNQQNSYLWAVVYKTLAEGMSEQAQGLVTVDMVHKLCKAYFLPRVPVPGTDKTVAGSTTDLCKSGNEAAFGDYVEQIFALAAHKGIFIPDPQ